MEKWLTLATELEKEEALLLPRITGKILQNLVYNNYATYEEESGEIIAFGALWETPDPHWRELGTLWVNHTHRGKGLSSKVFSTLMKNNVNKLMLITHNKKVVRQVEKFHWAKATISTWNAVPWCATCKPCDRIQEVQKDMCPFRAVDNECQLWFFIP